MSFHGSCHFILIQAKTTKQAKHISLWRRRRNHTSGRGIFLDDFFSTNWLMCEFLNQLISPPNQRNGFSTYKLLETKVSEWTTNLFGGGWALIWDSYQTKLQQTWPKIPSLESVKLPIFEKNISNHWPRHTVDGSEIRLTSWYGKYPRYFQGSIHPRWWLPDFWTINSRNLKRFISWTLVAPFGGYWMGFPPCVHLFFCFGCLLEWRILWRWECFCKWLNTDMCNRNMLGVLLCTLSNVNINPYIKSN